MQGVQMPGYHVIGFTTGLTFICVTSTSSTSCHKSQEQRRFNQLNQPWIYISMEIHHYFHQFVRKPLMTEIIEAKADQVPAFAEALKNHKG